MSKTLEEIQAEIATTAAAMSTSTEDTKLTAEALGATMGETGQLREVQAAASLSTAELLEQLAAKTGVSMEQLLAGLDAASSGNVPPAESKLPEGTKTYYSNIPNIGVMLQVGPAQCERVQFTGDTLHTIDPEVIEHMDKICDRPGSGIFSRSHREVAIEVAQMREELAAVAAKHQARMIAAGERLA